MGGIVAETEPKSRNTEGKSKEDRAAANYFLLSFSLGVSEDFHAATIASELTRMIVMRGKYGDPVQTTSG